MNLCIHSSLIRFGNIEGGVKRVYELIREVIGKKSTIVVPTYNFTLSSEDIYDPLKTKAVGMGALSNYVMNLPNSVRTLCPIHNHQIDGPLSHTLMSANPEISIGKGSFFDAMMQNHFYLLLLGATFQQGGTFIHHVEACRGVSYREWIELPRKIMSNEGKIEEINVKYYGKKGSSKTNLNRLEQILQHSNVGSTSSISGVTSRLVNLDLLFKKVSELLSSEPSILIEHLQ